MTSDEVKSRITGFYKNRRDKTARVLDALQSGELPPDAVHATISEAYELLIQLEIEKDMPYNVEEMKKL